MTSTTVSTFLCPSDGNTINRAMGQAPNRNFAECNYGNNLGTLLNFADGRFDGPAYSLSPGNVISSPVTLATITDGTSNTVIHSEWVKGKNAAVPGKGMVYVVPVSYTIMTSPPMGSGGLVASLIALSQLCQSSTTMSVMTTQGFSWSNMACGVGGGYSHINPPNKKPCYFSNHNANPNAIKEVTMVGAASNHSGGVNVGMLDGSVRLIKDSVSMQTWAAVATMAGSEVISADSL